jgi:hypothetical protein
MARDKGFLGWFFVPEGHMTVARRFIAGSRKHMKPASRRDARIPPLMPKPRIRLC